MAATHIQHVLRTGQEIFVREVGPDDKPLLQDAFEHLSAASRYKRFLAPVKALSAHELEYLTEIDHRDHEALVACGADGTPLGVARYVCDPIRTGDAEVAVAVVDEWQGRGVATALLDDLAAHALDQGVTTFTALCLASNREAIELLSELGEEIAETSADSGTVELRIRLPLETAAQPGLRGALCVAARGQLAPHVSAGDSVGHPLSSPTGPG